MNFIQKKIADAKKSFRSAQVERRADKFAVQDAKKQARAEYRRELVKETIKVEKQKAQYKAQAPLRRQAKRQEMIKSFTANVKKKQTARAKENASRPNPWTDKGSDKNNPWR